MNKKWIGIGLGVVVLAVVIIFATKERRAMQKELPTKENFSTTESVDRKEVVQLSE